MSERRQLMRHQRLGLRFLRLLRYQGILAFAPGTGKTIVAIRAMQKTEVPRLIICRRDDYLTWRLELEAEGVQEEEILFVESGKDDLPNPWDISSLDNKVPPMWFVVSYDLAKQQQIASWIKSQPFAIVAADELHYMKRWKARRTKKIVRCTRHIPRRLGLTGTLITNDPGDVYSQCLFVDNGRTFGNNWWRFRNKHYLQSGPGWYIKRNSKHYAIPDGLKKIAMSVHEDDVLDLPPTVPVLKSAPMSGMQRRYYDQALNDWALELESGETMELNLVIVRLTKLMQIANGFFYKDDEDRTPVLLKCPKNDLLINLIKDPDALGTRPKIVIWGTFTGQLARIAQLLEKADITHTPYFGHMNSAAKEASRKDFASPAGPRVFLAQVDRGVGMNELIIADTAIYLSNSFRVVSRQQSQRRTRRKGSEIHERIYNYDLITENSVEVLQARNLKKKISVANFITSQLKQGHKLKSIIKG
jgi:SNF2 family DNA or RNA helicase